MDPWETLLLIGFHFDVETLNVTLWIWPLSKFLLHLTAHLSNPNLSNLVSRMLWRTTSKALQKYWQMMTVVLSLFINAVTPLLKAINAAQALFALDKVMVAVSNHPPVLCMFQHSFQEDVLHDLSKHRSLTICSSQECSFLPILNMGAMFPLFYSLGILLDCHECWNMMERGLATSSSNSLRTLACIGALGLVYIHIPQLFSCWTFSLRCSQTEPSVMEVLFSPSSCLEVQGLETGILKKSW